MNTATVAAFFDELEAIEKTASPQDVLKVLKKGTQTLKKGITAPLKAGEKVYTQAGQKAFEHASKVVGSETANKAVVKGTELLHKFYT